MMFLSKSIGSNIRKLRMQKNLSQNDLAAALSVTRQTVSNYETGRSNPDLDMLERIAAALDTDLLCLLYGTPHSPEKKSFQKTDADFRLHIFRSASFHRHSLFLYIFFEIPALYFYTLYPRPPAADSS